MWRYAIHTITFRVAVGPLCDGRPVLSCPSLSLSLTSGDLCNVFVFFDRKLKTIIPSMVNITMHSCMPNTFMAIVDIAMHCLESSKKPHTPCGVKWSQRYQFCGNSYHTIIILIGVATTTIDRDCNNGPCDEENLSVVVPATKTGRRGTKNKSRSVRKTATHALLTPTYGSYGVGCMPPCMNSIIHEELLCFSSASFRSTTFCCRKVVMYDTTRSELGDFNACV